MKFIIQYSDYQREISGLVGFPEKSSNEHGPFGFDSRTQADRFAADHRMHEVEVIEAFDEDLTELAPAGYRD